MIAGGSEAAMTPSSVGGFSASQACFQKEMIFLKWLPGHFDIDRDGFVIGEGAGALILEEWDHAVQREMLPYMPKW